MTRETWPMAVVVVAALILAVGVGVVARAQDKPVTPAKAEAAQPTAPKFSEVQELKLRLSLSQEQAANQQIALLQVQIKQLGEERDKLLRAVEAEHVGWTIDRESFKFIAVAAKK